MTTILCRDMADLKQKIARDMQDRERRILGALHNTAHRGVPVMRKNSPVAFQEHVASIHYESLGKLGAKIVADSDHSAALETGSRPHMPPVDAIEKWVKLRGMQGMRGGKLAGTTSRHHARRMASRLKSMEKNGSMDIDAPRQIAWAIAFAIKKHGTKPHFYARNSLDEIVMILDQEIRAALPDRTI